MGETFASVTQRIEKPMVLDGYTGVTGRVEILSMRAKTGSARSFTFVYARPSFACVSCVSPYSLRRVRDCASQVALGRPVAPVSATYVALLDTPHGRLLGECRSPEIVKLKSFETGVKGKGRPCRRPFRIPQWALCRCREHRAGTSTQRHQA